MTGVGSSPAGVGSSPALDTSETSQVLLVGVSGGFPGVLPFRPTYPLARLDMSERDVRLNKKQDKKNNALTRFYSLSLRCLTILVGLCGSFVFCCLAHWCSTCDSFISDFQCAVLHPMDLPVPQKVAVESSFSINHGYLSKLFVLQ